MSRLSYITTLSYTPGFTLPCRRFPCYHPPPPSSLCRGGWLFCYQFRDFFLLVRFLALLQVVAVVYLFAFSSWTRPPHTINTTPELRPRPSISLKNRNPGNNRPRSPHSWLKPATLVCQRHSLLLGEVPPGRPPANMDPSQSGPPPFTAPTIQQAFPKSTPTSSGRPTRVEPTRFNSFPFGTRRPPGICVTTIRATPSPALLVEPFNFQQFRTHFFDNFGTINVPRPRIPGSPQKSGLATGPKPKIPSKNTL